MKAVKFKMDWQVPASSIDALGHVNNVTYLEWVQMVSEKHWESTARPEIKKHGKWVVISHYIEYKHPAFEGEELNLVTWVEKMEGVKSVRNVEISRKEDDQLLAHSQTVWCFVDAESLRPKRITEDMLVGFFEDKE